MFIIISKCLGGCSAARQFNHMIHSPSERSGLAVHHGEQRKWSQGDRSRLCVGKRHPTARLEQGGPRASPLILETVSHQNFLIRLVGETSLQMLIIMYNLARFLAVLSGKKSREVDKLFTELHAGKRHGSFISMHKKKRRRQTTRARECFVISSCRALYTLFWCALSKAQMDDPSLSVDIGTPAQSDRWEPHSSSWQKEISNCHST